MTCKPSRERRITSSVWIQGIVAFLMALGVEKFDEVQTSSVQLESGDSLLLFTDGVVEAHNDQMKMFGEVKLIQAFKERKDLKAKAIVDEMMSG